MPKRFFCLLFVAIFIFPFSSSAQEPEPSLLLDPFYEIPNLSAEADLMERQFDALAGRYEVLQQAQEPEELDELIQGLFLPDNADSFKIRYSRQLAISETGGDFKDWYYLSAAYLRGRDFNSAKTAVYRAFEKAVGPEELAKVLGKMAEIYRETGEFRAAANLYNKSLEVKENKNTRARFVTLLDKFDLRISSVNVDNEAERPRVCVHFNQNLKKPFPMAPRDYVGIEPAADADIFGDDRQICIMGLDYGVRYKLAIKPGLASANGITLSDTLPRTFTVEDRAERIIFGNGTYVLAKTKGETIPVTTVNLEALKLNLYRVNDRNLVPFLKDRYFKEDISSWQQQEIRNSEGTLLWQGEISVKKNLNREVVTLIPLKEIIEEKQPGIYALTAAKAQDEKKNNWWAHETQWLLVTDLGLTTFSGEDGLHVFVRSLASANAVKGITLILVAVNNEVLGSAKTDRKGIAHFPAGLSRGTGGNAPALLVANSNDGDFNFLRLVGPELDLSDRGISGRSYPGEMDAFLYPERGVYRPGEAVKLSVLLRDKASKALGDIPLTIKVVRPGGTEMFRQMKTGDDLGGYSFDIPLSSGARAGNWHATAFVDDENLPVGGARFQVEDFVPQRLEAKLEFEGDAVAANTEAFFHVKADYLYGAPAAYLEGEARVSISRTNSPFKGYEGFNFGVAGEQLGNVPQTPKSFKTDDSGKAEILLLLNDLPDTSLPIRATVEATIFDVSGRPVTTRKSVNIRAHQVEVGLKLKGSRDGFQKNQEVGFDIVALSQDGIPVTGRKVAYEWIREHPYYSWYSRSGRWEYKRMSYNEIIEKGEVLTGAEGLANINRVFGPGGYRLNIYDTNGEAVASSQFYVGWRSFSNSPDVPDALEMTLAQNSYNNGETLKGFVRPPFDGKAILTVVNDKVRFNTVMDVSKDGTEFELEVQKEWGIGAYVLVTAFRPGAGDISLLPVRSMGLAWFAIDRKFREVEVNLDIPEVVEPRQTITIPLKIEGNFEPGAPVKVTLAAVDEGILLLTRFNSPNPGQHYLDQRRLGIGLRDIYGSLIEAKDGQIGKIREGGDTAAMENAEGISIRSTKTVSLYQKDITIGPDGQGVVSLDIPNFSGRLRLMAVAYGQDVVGKGGGDLIVRDPLVAEVLLPRFLAPGDNAVATLSLHNLTGKDGTFFASLKVEGGLEVLNPEALEKEFTLKNGQRQEIDIQLLATTIGVGKIALNAKGEELTPVEKDWQIEIRPAQLVVTQRSVGYLEPGARVETSGNDLDAFLPGTASANITISARLEYNVPEFLQSLYGYPYACTEQSISRSMALLYYAEVAGAYGLNDDTASLINVIDRAILHIIDNQTRDGSFAVWSSNGRSYPWLTAYAVDFMTRAAERGHNVPKAAYGHAVDWLKQFVRRNVNDSELPGQAYAFYVLARIGETSLSDVRYYATNQTGKIPTRLGYGHIAAALAILGEVDRAEEFFITALKTNRPRHTYFWDYGSDLRDSAAVLALMAETFPGTVRQQKLIEILDKEFDDRRYFSTQEQAWLVLATHRLSTGGGGKIELDFNGKIIGPQSPAFNFSIGKNEALEAINIQNIGDNAARLVKSIRGVPTAPQPATSEGFTITRTILDMTGKRVDLSDIHQNDLMIVLIEGSAESQVGHEALLADLLPAGFEIENTAIGGATFNKNYKFLPRLTPTEFEAARDDRYIAAINFHSYWSRNKFAIAYMVRAVTPGEYVLPGVFIEDMYRPRYQARGPVQKVIIKK